MAVYLLSVVIWTQLVTLSEDLPTYSSRINELVDKANDKLDDLEKKTVDMIVPSSLREQEQQIQQKPQEAAKARAPQAIGSRARADCRTADSGSPYPH